MHFLTYATTNKSKIEMMKRFLKPLNIEVVGLSEALPDALEGERSPLLNARKKAFFYYDILKTPVFSCDSGLFFENVPEEFQPGTNVRVVKGKRLSDDQMIEHYSALAKMFGNLVAQYQNAICLIIDENNIFEYDGEDLRGEKFLIGSQPHKDRHIGFPLDSLSIHLKSQKYYMDLSTHHKGFSMEKGFQDFFKRVFSL